MQAIPDLTKLWGPDPIPGPFAERLRDCTLTGFRSEQAQVTTLHEIGKLSPADFAKLYTVSQFGDTREEKCLP